MYSNIENLSHWGAGSPIVGLPYGTLVGTLTSFYQLTAKYLFGSKASDYTSKELTICFPRCLFRLRLTEFRRDGDVEKSLRCDLVFFLLFKLKQHKD